MSEAGEKDYYKILGAGRDASRDEIGRRYKRLAAERHPDRGGSEEEMRDLNEAYRVLRDADARESYDELRCRREAPSQAAYVPSRAPFINNSPAAHADAVWGRVAGAALAVFAGLVLLFLVRVHYVVFLWPLALLAAALVFFGVWMAHAAVVYARAGFAPSHLARRSAWAQEAVFWSVVVAGACGIYLLLTAF